MPHSVSSNESPPPDRGDDEVLPDAPPAADNANAPEEQKAGANVRLEDLFADDDDDEEFPASSVADVKMASSPPPVPAA